MREDTIRHNAAVRTVAAYLRALYARIPEVQVYTEYTIKGAGLKPGTDGRADVVVYWDDYVFIWEVKSAKTAELSGPATLDRYVRALQREERKSGRTVQRGSELPQVATIDPLNPKQTLVAQSTRSRSCSPRTGEQCKGVIGWWTRKHSDKASKGYEPAPVHAPVTIQVWQPTPEQQKQIAWSTMAAGAMHVLGKMVTSPFGLE